jgi:uncharacterized protein involved in high-affinity Fe2+ transport
MKMKMKKLPILVLALVVALSLGFAACSGGGDDSADTSSDTTAEETSDASGDAEDSGAAAPGETAGFEEFPIGDDIELGPLNVAGVYFQPVDMEPAGNSLPAAESDAHLEADISALENELGYGLGDFVPNLTVKYEIESEDGTVQEGNFMPMSASDGPHYGANVVFGPAGTYKVRFIIENPEAQGYLLHTDEATGVTGKFWTEPLVAEWDDFDWVPRTW